MSNNIIGKLYGVDIFIPIARKNIREVAKAQANFIDDLVKNNNLNENQAALDASDILTEFQKKLTEEDARKLVDLLYEEGMALTQTVENVNLVDANMQAEAENYHLQATFIFNELSANLRVYGNNSPLTVGIPADIGLALQYINRSLEIQPNNPTYLNLKGLLVWQGLKNKEEGLLLIQRAAELAPRNINIQNNLKAVKDSGCFIATAAYGTPIAHQIDELRRWRDTKLKKTLSGRFFIKTYYKVSPSIANLIVERPIAKKIVRQLLKPLIIYLHRKNDSR